jgi:SagB-type dehydrogenase family enzyme
LSAALDYHRATNVEAGGSDEDLERTLDTYPILFKAYGEAERASLDITAAGPILGDGAAVLRTATHYGAPGKRTVHFRGYSSAGALYPIEAYVATPDALYSFDALTRELVRLRDGDVRADVAAAVDADGDTFVVLTGIHARTGWKYAERGYRHVWWDAGTMLANVLALAVDDDLSTGIYTAFVDRDLNTAVGVDGVDEYALAAVALGKPDVATAAPIPKPPSDGRLQGRSAGRFPLAEATQAASSLTHTEHVRTWRTPPPGEEPKLDRQALVDAIRRRRSVRHYGDALLPHDEVAALVAWSEAPIPADAPSVVRQRVTVAAVDGLPAGTYDAQLELLRAHDDDDLRRRVGFAAMEQDHSRLAALNVFQLGDLEAVVDDLGDRGYRWAQLEAGIRAGRLQIGAFMRGWGAAASTFYDAEVSRLLETDEAPLLMVAVGPR